MNSWKEDLSTMLYIIKIVNFFREFGYFQTNDEQMWKIFFSMYKFETFPSQGVSSKKRILETILPSGDGFEGCG